MHESGSTWHQRHRLNALINVSGTMTALGSSLAAPGVAAATAEAMDYFVSIHEAQARASEAIARLTAAEAGFLTASASAGITLAAAGCMTGLDPARVEALPFHAGERHEVVVQAGHLCGYGAPIEQALSLAGARVRTVGQSTLCMDHQVLGGLNEHTAAAVFVVSHHVVHYGQCPLDRFAELCHSAGVPVIVDAASEYDLRGFIEAGADVVIYSGHKFLGGPTSGIVAGRRDLIRAAYLQNMGIGRGMKIGKESIFGTIAALQAWEIRDHAAARAAETRALTIWIDALAGLPGVTPRVVPDPTGNPLDRLQVELDPAALGANAATVARVLAECDPAIIVRNHEVELGFFELDPCNLKDGQAEVVAESLRSVLTQRELLQARPEDADSARNGSTRAYLSWGADTA